MDESNNPYESPKASVEREQQAEGGWIPGKGNFDVGECLSDGWRNTIDNFGPVLGVTLLGMVLMMVSYLTCIGLFVLVPVIIYGMTRFLLNTHDGRCDFNDLFVGFKSYGKVLPQTLVLFLLTILLSMIGASVQYIGMFAENETLILIGGLLSMVWTLAVMIRLYWAWYFLVDQDMDAVSSLKASWNATSGNWIGLILLGLLSFVVSLAGFLALIIGIFVATPIVYLMFTSGYRQAVGRPAASAEREFV